MTTTPLKRSPLERTLGVFTEVKAGEGRSLLLLTVNIYLILTAYYIIKPVREALILAGGGAELKSYASAGQAILLLLLVVPAYSWLAGKLPRRRLINSVNIFFIVNLVLFYLLAQLQVNLGLVFFLWVGIFNLMVPAQFWSFANDLYTIGQGKRLFVIVAFGASAGAISGSWISSLLITPLGVYQMLLVSAGLLGLALVLTNIVESRSTATATATVPAGTTPPEDQSLGTENAFAMVIRNRYLLLIALLVLMLNWVNTIGEYILGQMVTEYAANEAEKLAAAAATTFDADAFKTGFIGKFYADFFTGVNITGVVIQLLLVSRILKYLGVRVAIAILPVIAMGSYLVLVFFPALGILRWTKTMENATDYSLQNTVRQALFLPTTRAQKYKAKQAIDTFFMRAGDVLSALLVFVGINILNFSTTGFAITNLFLAGIWIVLAIALGREYVKLTSNKSGATTGSNDQGATE